jgi:A/G-specific adenine glycosylase
VRGDAVWLVRRQGRGMLGGMRALPDDAWSAKGDGHGEPPLPGEWTSRGMVRHGFTHFEIELEVLACAGNTDMPGEGTWWPLDRLADAGLPTLFAKAAQRAIASP